MKFAMRLGLGLLLLMLTGSLQQAAPTNPVPLRIGLLLDGDSEISRQLNISIATVKYHLTNIYTKLGAKNRVEAASIALDHNLLDKHQNQ